VRVLRSLVRPSLGVPATTAPPFDADAVATFLATSGGAITEHAAARLLDLVGVDRPWSRLLTDASEAQEVADRSRVVAKIQSPHVLHKTERGGVVTDVTPDALPDVVARLFRAFRDDEPEGVLVQEQIDDGVELLVGLTRGEDGAAPLVTVGIGGVTAELYRDTATTFAPVAPDRARELLLGLRAAPLLTGFRGRPAVDLDRVADAISRISHLGVLAGDRLRELEVNPLRATPDGRVIALDFLMVTDDHDTTTRTENDA
jgi:succinyl-CoA synthetase beta subunit